MKIEASRILVTGGARGIGRSLVDGFLKDGALVGVFEKDATGCSLLAQDFAGKVATWECDVSNPENVDRALALARESGFEPDVLVNNAGVMDDFIPVDRIVNKQWQHIMDVNLNGPFYAMRAVLPIMLKHGKGVILNIASVGGLFGSRAGAAYTASKHALIGLTKNSGFMYAQKGIRCNAIAPGGVNTHIADSLIPDALGYERCISGASFMPRMGEPEEIAQIAAHLCSDEASFINGAVITADGGWTAY